jgi:ankyrin repeat protein
MLKYLERIPENKLNIKNKKGLNLLHISCLYSNFPLIEQLVLKKIDVNAQDGNGKTALHYLCENSGVKINSIKAKKKNSKFF